ncbi:hypothetical protein GGX14DRAFT_562597 [Mycena pura]|uniref:Uncharacterized protein n=1 Tax=Mycena pura TaxID=153505 RepID=A0AAD6VK06_9AGAR|nr:hypothetical protein GGX14DRAFT_392412 [Mycena pura]KAJ7215381.1 hypothetical protein GGX14DRAFT_562597 [Mycena pura]
MPSSNLPPSSPLPSSPSRATDDLMDIVQQMTPSKPPDVLRRLRRNLQSIANDVQEDNSSLKRRITDLENQSASTARPRKQRRRGNRAAHADDSVPNPQTIEERTREKGRHFLVQEALFLVDPDVFTVDIDEDFDPRDEFSSDKNKIQGQLRQIMHYLPDDVKRLRTTELISGAFTDGMASQRSSTSNRLRGASLSKIVDNVKPFETSSGRFNAFAELIGYQPGTDTREPYYSKLDVPLLYDAWQGKKDLNSLFRNPIILKTYASVIRGPNGADGLFSGKLKRPVAKTVDKMYKIHCSVPGAIVNSTILSIWLHSADTQLVEIGDETGINYRERHSYYLQRILDGLADNKAWAVGLLAHWDQILFPDADKPRDHGGSAANDRLEAEDDDEDFFGSAPAHETLPAPSTTEAPRLSSPSPSNNDDGRRSSSPTPLPRRSISSSNPSRRHPEPARPSSPPSRRSEDRRIPGTSTSGARHDRAAPAQSQSARNIYRR